MGILRNFARIRRWMTGNKHWRLDDAHCTARELRVCRFEQLEERKYLAADIHLGSVYYEPATGDDSKPNIIQVTFEGGAPGTQLTRIVIDGDKNHDGKYSAGEIFFDTAAGGQGVFGSAPLQIVSSNGFTVVNSQVVDGGQKLIFDLSGFDAGEKLVFSIDVDEVQFIDPDSGDIDINSLVEGGEFQRSILTGTFTAPHFENAQGSALYFDAYNANFAAADASSGTTLNLPPDSYEPPSTIDQTDLTAGAVLTLKQVPLPITLAGTVYHDRNLDNSIDAGEEGIANVSLTLLQWDGSNWVSTGKTTTTDASGNYKFTGLLPGTYRVAETQPSGWLSVGSQVGTVDGAADGISVNPDLLSEIALLGGQDGIHYNFGESLPNSIHGRVHADPEGDCEFGPNDIPLKDVKIELLNANGQVIATTFTDESGFYQFDNLGPGTYSVREYTPVGYIDDEEHVGTVDGVTNGTNPSNDLLANIVLVSGSNGVHYDFCENLPNSISGRVHADPEGDCEFGPNDIPLAGVKIELLNADGQVIATTFTDKDGFYKFDNLGAGSYSVREYTPAGYIDDEEHVGTVDGVPNGTNPSNDLLANIVLVSGDDGVHYDFCENLPNSISGRVHADPEGDCEFGPNDIPLAGVKIELLNADGQVIATTFTDENGFYKFDHLGQGTYSVREYTPAGYIDDEEHVGTVNGVTNGTNPSNDLLANIVLVSGDDGVHYDFCENLPNSISGRVHADPEGDCEFGPNDIPLAGVKIELLNAEGQVIKTTFTDENGFYKFDNLGQGTYSVREYTPAGYIDDEEHVGTVDGVPNGTNPSNDLLANIVLVSGDDGVHYDFCENIPNSISGRVHADPEGDCEFGPNDIPLQGVKIELLDGEGHVIATTFTDEGGFYKFDNLGPGTYSVREYTPAGYIDDEEHVGTVDGVPNGTNPSNDLLANIVLVSGDNGIHYDFCENIPNSIRGRVHADPERDCIFGPNDIPLAGVKVELLDAEGQVIGTTFTDSQGFYEFSNLPPGTYGVREYTPVGYFDGSEEVGQVGGVDNGALTDNDLITQIVLLSDDHGVNYDFCEWLPGAISGYVFKDGPTIALGPNAPTPKISDVRDGQRTPDDKPIAGVTLMLCDEFGNPILDSHGDPRTTVTNAQGYYEFTNLDQGTYLVREFQPNGYIDGIDTPGTTGGVAINENTDPASIPSLPFSHNFDVIAKITLGPGQVSTENNFSEVQMRRVPPPPPEIGGNPPAIPALLGPAPLVIPPLVIPPYQPLPYIQLLDGSDGFGYTWHLSIVDAGYPRGPNSEGIAQIHSGNIPAEVVAWASANLTRGEWIMLDDNGNIVKKETIACHNAIPVAGDFNGDGVVELGLYVDGEWFIDLNGDGIWDSHDLWAKLGTREDKPVVGDWDGDGKDDIGIYGPAWARDPHAIKREPGLPDPLNKLAGVRKKNVPPSEEDAPLGKRKLKNNGQGKQREDLIDHVFHYGEAIDQPIVGDWNGAGIRRIGIFHDGNWYLDIDGNGRWSPGDVTAFFGQHGDIPVIGDWNGDGVENIGVYRNGTFYLDTNGNHQLDSGDRVVQLGQPGDLPVVGDFNGDGRDEVAVYHEQPEAVETAAVPKEPVR